MRQKNSVSCEVLDMSGWKHLIVFIEYSLNLGENGEVGACRRKWTTAFLVRGRERDQISGRYSSLGIADRLVTMITLGENVPE